ncbi:MAG TPA: NAD(P)-dependent oxidoreductase [Candidatus Omnitrophota bacterium]|nr:NAD(P)-dependent oxidoreductase [Candidatus Omnitrophota bacterium]
MDEIRKIIILGNGGFIGAHLEESFRQRFSETRVVGYDLPQMDLTRIDQAAQLANVLDRQTAVIMCAFIKRQMGDTLEAYEKNMLMTTNLCRVLEKNPVKRFIYFSSAAVYGEDVHSLQITEETPVNPRSYYGMAKFSSERLLWKAAEKSLVILRPATIYGPGDMSNAYGPSGFLQSAIAGKEITLWGDGSELREFIYVDDIVEIVQKIITSDYGGVVNVASGKSYSFRDALKEVSRTLQSELKVTSRPRSKEKVDNAFNNERLRSIVGDRSFTTLKEGIRLMYEIHKQELIKT